MRKAFVFKKMAELFKGMLFSWVIYNQLYCTLLINYCTLLIEVFEQLL